MPAHAIETFFKGPYLTVSEFLQLIEITVFLMEHVSCSPDGIMEWWNGGMLECWFE